MLPQLLHPEFPWLRPRVGVHGTPLHFHESLHGDHEHPKHDCEGHWPSLDHLSYLTPPARTRRSLALASGLVTILLLAPMGARVVQPAALKVVHLGSWRLLLSARLLTASCPQWRRWALVYLWGPPLVVPGDKDCLTLGCGCFQNVLPRTQGSRLNCDA